MTFRAIDPAVAKIYYAEEADRPITTLNIPDGSLVIFTDSGLEDSFDAVANAWFNREQITQASGGETAGLFIPKDVPLDAKGNYPATWWLQGSATIPLIAVDDSVVYESGDISMYNDHVVENDSPVDAVTVQGTLDGVNWSADLAVTGVAVSPLIEPGEFGEVDTSKWFKIRVLKDGTTSEIPLIRFAHAVK